MSKNLRVLLASLLLLAPSSLSRAQEEVEETEVVETEEVPAEQKEAQEASPEPEKKEDEKEEGEAAEAEEPEAEQQAEKAPEAEEEKTAEPEDAPEKETPEAEEQKEETPEAEATEEKTQEEATPEAEPVTLEPRKYGEDEVMGIDTVDLANPQGNWLYKRVWWERAEAKFERIRETVGKVMEVRTSFFAKRAELDKNVLDPFYIKIGMSQGELQEILSELLVRSEKMAESAESDQIQKKAEEDKKNLQDLQKQVQNVVAQDEEVEKAILMLVEQITKVRGIEQQAWQDFKGIARVLDDKKARELFYKVDAAWRNIKELQQYIEQKFAGSFDELIVKVKKEVERVDQEMKAIKESGVDLKQRLLGAQRAQMEMDEDEQEEAPKGFFTRYIIDPITGLFKAIWSVITWPYRAIFGGPVDDEIDDEDEGQDEVAQEPEEIKVTEEVTVEESEPEQEGKTQEPEQPAEDEQTQEDEQQEEADQE